MSAQGHNQPVLTIPPFAGNVGEVRDGVQET